MRENRGKWPRVVVPMPPDVLARLDKVVATQRRKNPGMVVTRLDVIREYIAAGLPS